MKRIHLLAFVPVIVLATCDSTVEAQVTTDDGSIYEVPTPPVVEDALDPSNLVFEFREGVIDSADVYEFFWPLPPVSDSFTARR